MTTKLRPWQLLPASVPKTTVYSEDYFYENFAKPLISDTVRLMSNGLPVDLEKVQQLEDKLDSVLAEVKDSLNSNPIIQEYVKLKYDYLVETYKKEQEQKQKSFSDFLKPFNHKDLVHRSYFMHVFSADKDIKQPENLLPSEVPKWTSNDVKKISHEFPALQLLLNGKLSSTNTIALKAMQLLAEHKAEMYNKTYQNNISTLAKVQLPEFNPGSADQKHDVLTSMLGYASSNYTDAYQDYLKALDRYQRYGKALPVEPKNMYSWSRDDIKELFPLAKNENETSLFQALFDYSMGAIIKNNFIKAFYEHTHDGRLFGEYVLGGAKSFRYTSKAP